MTLIQLSFYFFQGIFIDVGLLLSPLLNMGPVAIIDSCEFENLQVKMSTCSFSGYAP
jgi:hypothetical protein